jgi:hypothetical protein
MSRIRLLLLLSMTALPLAAAHGAVYHVSPAGNDANPGTDARPWKTIGKAAAALGPGDTVLIGTGTYRERVILTESGRPGGYITFSAATGGRPVIDGTGIPLEKDEGLFQIARASHVRVLGLHVSNSGHAGILAENAEDLVIQGNHTERTASSGIGVWGCRAVTVNGNEVAFSCSGVWQEAISIGGTDGFEVRSNLVYNGPAGFNKEGICLKDGSAHGRVSANEVHHVHAVGIYVDAWNKHTHDIDVFGNNVHDIQDNSGIALASEMGGLLENIRICNNISWNNRYCGIVISRNGDSPTHPMRGIMIGNNTVFGNGTTGWGGGILADDPGLLSAVIRNNISAGNFTFEIGVAESRSAVIVDHNLSYGSHDDPAEVSGDSALRGDPLFVDPLSGNFKVKPASPAIDSGSPVGAPRDDYDGTSRPKGAGVDMGAFER